MLDRNGSVVLNIINGISDGAYKIIDADDIISAMPTDIKLTRLELSGIIRSLVDHELIAVKYSNLEEYCLAALPKARIIAEKEREKAIVAPQAKLAYKPTDISSDETDDEDSFEETKVGYEIKPYIDYGRIKRSSLISSFCGAFFGSMLAGLICIGILLLLYN